ncbi:hypothetical protein FF011L_12560 [Roseimaritima multifibrata]|uniref:Uncharacterized protein n=1 Tax=Roseimaritima multifibrata TaxID=1930274 RepID=A0A517MC86_9BACT|nr:hypothetical protein FF011L_12560 [Roseimaritima multifibrata]
MTYRHIKQRSAESRSTFQSASSRPEKKLAATFNQRGQKLSSQAQFKLTASNLPMKKLPAPNLALTPKIPRMPLPPAISLAMSRINSRKLPRTMPEKARPRRSQFNRSAKTIGKRHQPKKGRGRG